MSNFPSIITSFPQPTASSRLNNPSHSALENLQSSTIAQIEAVIGLDSNSSILGTIIGDLRSPGSKGGGHVQGAAFGGTGQTVYAKGDILVGQSSSVLAKQGVGADGQALVADSTQSAGIKWATFPGKLYISASVISVPNNVETSVFSVSVPGGILGTNNALRTTVYLRDNGFAGSVQARFNYGNNLVSSIVYANISGTTSVYGTISHLLIANGDVAKQTGITTTQLSSNPTLNTTVSSMIGLSNVATSSVNSAATAIFGMTLLGSTNNFINVNGVVIEKIS